MTLSHGKLDASFPAKISAYTITFTIIMTLNVLGVISFIF